MPSLPEVYFLNTLKSCFQQALSNWEAAVAISSLNSSPSMLAIHGLISQCFSLYSFLSSHVICITLFLPWRSQYRPLPHQKIPLSLPSIPKGTHRSLILSNLTFLFLQTPMVDVLYFVLYIYIFTFCPPYTFQFSKGQVIFISYPFMLLSTVLGLKCMISSRWMFPFINSCWLLVCFPNRKTPHISLSKYLHIYCSAFTSKG